jgi:hypothetical protein
MVNGVKYVETFGNDNGINEAIGPITTGISAKTSRGTASHKVEEIVGRERAILSRE